MKNKYTIYFLFAKQICRIALSKNHINNEIEENQQALSVYVGFQKNWNE